MIPAPTEQNPEPSLAGRRLQRRRTRTRNGSVGLGEDLDQFEDAPEAQALQRLADQEVVLALQLTNFDEDSSEYQVFANALAAYRYQVFMGWQIAGVIYEKAASHGPAGVYGLSKIPVGLKLEEPDASAIASELVMESIAKFRTETLMNPQPERRWDPTRGASIKTFFIGRCLMEFPRVYSRWKRYEKRARKELSGTDRLDTFSDLNSASAERVSVARIAAEEAFHDVDPETAYMVQLHATGWTYEEIAELLTNEGTETQMTMVRSRIHRFRKESSAT